MQGTHKHRSIFLFPESLSDNLFKLFRDLFLLGIEIKNVIGSAVGTGYRFELRLMRTISNAFAHLLQLNVFFREKSISFSRFSAHW